MGVSCEEVWRKLSNYVEEQLDPALCAAMEEHFRVCRHCAAVLEGTRNVIAIYGDERIFKLPAGFSQRLKRRLAAHMRHPRGSVCGWVVAVASAALLVASLAVGNSSALTRPRPCSGHAQPGAVPIPAATVVVRKGMRLAHDGGGSISVRGGCLSACQAKLREEASNYAWTSSRPKMAGNCENIAAIHENASPWIGLSFDTPPLLTA